MAVVKLNKTTGLLGSINEWCWDEKEKFVPNPMKKETNPFNKMGTKVGKPKEKYRDKPHISHDNLQKTILQLVDTINGIIDELAHTHTEYTTPSDVTTAVTTAVSTHKSTSAAHHTPPSTGGTTTGGRFGGPVRSMKRGGKARTKPILNKRR